MSDRLNPSRPDPHEPQGTTYRDYEVGSGSGKSPWAAATTLMFKEKTVVPINRARVDGDVRLAAYAMLPLLGVLLTLVLLGWFNIAMAIKADIFQTAMLAILFHFVLQAGLPLRDFGAAASAFFSNRRQDIQLKLMADKRVPVSGMLTALFLAAIQTATFFYLMPGLYLRMVPTTLAIFGVFVFSRAAASYVSLQLPSLDEDEEDGSSKTLKTAQLVLLITIGVAAVALILSGYWSALIALVLMGLVAWLCLIYFKNRFNGVSRAMGGFLAQLTETVGLLALILFMKIGTFLW